MQMSPRHLKISPPLHSFGQSRGKKPGGGGPQVAVEAAAMEGHTAPYHKMGTHQQCKET
ncbi:unnamed protein product [Staurois parvus]|uniref:Uncharacterized protein n=1 Tax=Staurois parvus TaxID=386267 RepID=A0ABN9HGS1_9NEOB|nr:unnamed protein product [Staurois parvus]